MPHHGDPDAKKGHGLLSNFSVHTNVASMSSVLQFSFGLFAAGKLSPSHNVSTHKSTLQMYIAHKSTLHTNVHCTGWTLTLFVPLDRPSSPVSTPSRDICTLGKVG